MAGRSTLYAARALALLLACLLASASAWALGEEPKPGESVTQYLTPTILQAICPGAE
jgi:hypothetical protein